MKKQFLLIYLILTAAVAFSSNVDYGATIDSYVGTDTDTLFGSEKLSLYGSLQATDSVSFAIDGFYKFGYSSSDPTHTLDLATLVAIFPLGPLNVQLGRSYMSDYSGDIFAHTLDGVIASMNFGSVSVSVNAGYSGFINLDNNTIITTAVDLADQKEDGIYNVNIAKRVIEGVDIVAPIGSVTGWISIYSSQDMNSIENNLSVFVGGGVKGSIGTDKFYSVRANYQGGMFPYLNVIDNDSEAVMAGMGVATLDWYIQDQKFSSLSPAISLNIGVSSGDDTLSTTSLGAGQSDIESSVSLYSPIVSGGPGIVYSVVNQNLLYGKIGASISPINNLQTQLGSVAYFRTVEGVTSDSSVNADASGHYLGTEVSLTVNYRPFSDLGISVNGGCFFPNDSVVESEVTGIVTAYISLSL